MVVQNMNAGGNWVLEQMAVLVCRQHEFPNKYIHAIDVGINISQISGIPEERWGNYVTFMDFLK